MKTYKANQNVPAGLYFDLHELTFVTRDEQGPLPGDARSRYLRTPILAMLVVGPVLGLIYAIFLPFIGLAMVAMVAVEKLAAGTQHAAQAFTRVLRPAWQPARAFFGRGKAAKRKAEAPPATDAWAKEAKDQLAAPDKTEANGDPEC